MATNYSPTIVTDGAVFVGDALMPSTATSATKLYNRAGSGDGTMYAGSCFDFDGTDDVVKTSNPIITGTGDFTFTACINRATVNTYDFICGNYGSGNTTGVEFYGINTGEVRCHISGSVTSSTALAAGTWYHVGVTRSAGVVQVYINGVADGAAVTRASSIGGSNNFTIGNGEDYTSENMDGKIADVKVFNVALSAANMKELYDNSKVIIPSNISQTNLKGWWSLAEGTGNTCYDGSGNGYHGTATNTDGDEWLIGQTGAPQLIEGYNKPMLFSNAGSDYVQATSTSTGPLANQNYTIAAWVNPAVSPPGADRGIFSYDFTSHANPYYAIHVRLLSDGKVFFSWNDGMTYRDLQTTGDVTAANTWVHIACTHTSGSQKIYINGVENNSSTRTDTITFYNQEIWIGRTNYGAYFDGIINEVVVYDSVLTLAQVQALAATDANGGPLPPDPMSMSNSSNVVGYWRNDGNTTWTDRSSNSSNGTVYGSPSALLLKQGYNGQDNTKSGRDSQGFPLKHKNVGAIGFVSDSYVTVPSLGTSGEFSNCTISIWFNKQNQIDTYGNLFDCNFDITDYNKGPRMEIAADNSVIKLYLAADNGNYYAAPAGTFSNDIWTNIAWKITTIGTSKQIVTPYINGVNSYAATEQTDSAYFWDGDIGALNIGRGFSSARTFTGDIGNFRIYDRGLSAAEILQNYNAQKSRFT